MPFNVGFLSCGASWSFSSWSHLFWGEIKSPRQGEKPQLGNMLDTLFALLRYVFLLSRADGLLMPNRGIVSCPDGGVELHGAVEVLLGLLTE